MLRRLIAFLLRSAIWILKWLLGLFEHGDDHDHDHGNDGHHHGDDPDDSDTKRPPKPGEVAPDVTISPAQTQQQIQRTFASAVAGTVGGSDPTPDVVWVDGDNELLVRPSKTRVVLRTGFVLIGISVNADQTGDVEIVVPFAVGAPNEPLGLIASTDAVPRGPDAIVTVWGDQLIAAAWDALLRFSAMTAGTAGVDEDHQPLLPMAIVADTNGLTVTPQARHTFDRVPR